MLAEMGLNIQEAHAFSAVDRYSLDVFVVDAWPYEISIDCPKEYLMSTSGTLGTQGINDAVWH
ncbi:hypothetical protein M8C21_015934 [Ambrosia artemisiifolia]|uniref:Uncharacterized protein n=1 Tax=Ambrosia artemisiifolia TaxID=4212 RepID=A0AAD5CNR7_AMBAR|nr:hypothetical protein M8C21_015934 [Ambrosia artemisiifolia]